MQRIGRYVLHEVIASGGMATVHLAQVIGDAGFKRTVAIKRLHPHVAAEPLALEMFVDEATLSSRVRHRNIVTTLDVVREGDELFLVMEYVHGVPLSLLERRAKEGGERLPLPVVSAIVLDALSGLEAVHSATDELGRPLSIVHRDVSPQNILVGIDGAARVLDFGIAKAAVRLQTTKNDQLKGKLRYMAPEQLMDAEVDGRTDEFAAGCVLWGLLTGEPLFDASTEAAVIAKVLEGVILPPSRYVAGVPAALDAVVMSALGRRPDARFPTCHAMADALRQALPPAEPGEVRRCVEGLAGDVLRARTELIARFELGAPANAASAVDAVQVALSGHEHTITNAASLPNTARVGSRRRSRAALVALAASACLGALIIVITANAGPRSNERRPSIEPAASSAPSDPPVPVSVAPSSPGASTAALASPGASTAALASSSASTAPLASPGAPIARREPSKTTVSGARPKRLPDRSTSAPSAPCAQLYVVDANGIKRVKPECL